MTTALLWETLSRTRPQGTSAMEHAPRTARILARVTIVRGADTAMTSPAENLLSGFDANETTLVRSVRAPRPLRSDASQAEKTGHLWGVSFGAIGAFAGIAAEVGVWAAVAVAATLLVCSGIWVRPIRTVIKLPLTGGACASCAVVWFLVMGFGTVPSNAHQPRSDQPDQKRQRAMVCPRLHVVRRIALATSPAALAVSPGRLSVLGREDLEVVTTSDLNDPPITDQAPAGAQGLAASADRDIVVGAGKALFYRFGQGRPTHPTRVSFGTEPGPVVMANSAAWLGNTTKSKVDLIRAGSRRVVPIPMPGAPQAMVANSAHLYVVSKSATDGVDYLTTLDLDGSETAQRLAVPIDAQAIVVIRHTVWIAYARELLPIAVPSGRLERPVALPIATSGLAADQSELIAISDGTNQVVAVSLEHRRVVAKLPLDDPVAIVKRGRSSVYVASGHGDAVLIVSSRC